MRCHRHRARRRSARERGASAVEYGLLLAAAAILVLGGMAVARAVAGAIGDTAAVLSEHVTPAAPGGSGGSGGSGGGTGGGTSTPTPTATPTPTPTPTPTATPTPTPTL